MVYSIKTFVAVMSPAHFARLEDNDTLDTLYDIAEECDVELNPSADFDDPLSEMISAIGRRFHRENIEC